ncbi:MAG: pyrimidine-nucleoside phosphorylase, partial [Proteobacteria bacterium]|nr:pyrimidine-nucleoside phosphorylase [Pseudomonadota bacterium]
MGNALEVVEAVQLLKGQCRPEQRDLLKLSTRLAAHMAVLGGKASDVGAAEKMVGETIDDLSAFDKFKEIVLKQGGDPSVLDHPSKLPTAVKNHGITAPSDGSIQHLDALLIGKASVLLGAGRESLDSTIDYAVGAVLRKKIGDRVAKDETIM